MHKEPSFLVAVGLVGITAVSGVALMAPRGNAVTQAASSRASVTVSSTCSMTATVNTEHNATLINGMYSGNDSNYNNGIGKTTIQTFCNDAGGYAIYAVGFGNNEVGGNKLHSNILGSNYDIATGTATSGDTSNWSMKVTALTGTIDGVEQAYAPTITNDYDAYSPVPTSYTKVARFDRSTDAETIGSSITTTYAAYISQTQPAGTYVGQVKYALVHPGTSNAPESLIMQNVADWKETLLVGEEIAVTDARDGKSYTVARLCTKLDENNNPLPCTQTDEDSEIWMTQNLDLTIGGEYNGEPIILDSTNTDINTDNIDGVTFAAYTNNDGVITWDSADIGNGEITFPTSGASSTVSGWTNSNSTPFQAEGIDANGNEVFVYKGTRYFGLAACEAAKHTEAECMHYSVGNYYNFTAAVAMSYSDTTTDEGGSTYFDDDKYVMPNSICPKGWRLPNGLTDDNGTTVMSDFNRVLKANNVTGTGGTNGVDLTGGGVNVGYSGNGWSTINSKPLYFVRPGYLNGSAFHAFTSYGNYWSSTVRSGFYAYYLHFYSDSLTPANSYYRYYGWSVRCVAR